MLLFGTATSKDTGFVPTTVVELENRVVQVMVIVPPVALGILAARVSGTGHRYDELTPVAMVPEAATAELPDALSVYARSWVNASAYFVIEIVILLPSSNVEADTEGIDASGTVSVMVVVEVPTSADPL